MGQVSTNYHTVYKNLTFCSNSSCTMNELSKTWQCLSLDFSFLFSFIQGNEIFCSSFITISNYILFLLTNIVKLNVSNSGLNNYICILTSLLCLSKCFSSVLLTLSLLWLHVILSSFCHFFQYHDVILITFVWKTFAGIFLHIAHYNLEICII